MPALYRRAIAFYGAGGLVETRCSNLKKMGKDISHIVCPYWIGYLLVSPLRRLVQNPERILVPFVGEGMTILEIGPGMGFFTLPLARMVGAKGKIVCVDVQEKMLRLLRKRALKAGLADRILTRVCDPMSLGVADLSRKIDFVFAYAVVHEVPDIGILFDEIVDTLKPGARCFVAEPSMHVSASAFERTIAVAKQRGLRLTGRPRVARSRTALMTVAQ